MAGEKDKGSPGFSPGDREEQLHSFIAWACHNSPDRVDLARPFTLYELPDTRNAGYQSPIRGPPFVLHFKKIRNGGQKDARMDQD